MNKLLKKLCEQVRGMSLHSAEAGTMLGAADWKDHYPVVDANRRYTGELLDMRDHSRAYSVINGNAARFI